MRTGILLVILLMVVIVAITRCGGAAEETKPNGKDIYSQQCGLCHGSNGDLGATGASPLSMSKLTLEQRIEIITNGRAKMSGFAGLLTAEEIKLVAEYLDTLKK